MKYVGSKRLIAKHILPIIIKDRKPEQYYIEPFCGGLNTIERVTGPRIKLNPDHSASFTDKELNQLCNILIELRNDLDIVEGADFNEALTIMTKAK